MRPAARRPRPLLSAVRTLGHRVKTRGTTWKKLTRGDLTKFDDVATKAILTAMERGGLGRVSARGHATIRATDGKTTMSISGNTSAPHSVQNIQADLKRLFPEPVAPKDPAMNGDVVPIFSTPLLPATIISQNGRSTDVEPEEALLPCPAKGCDKEFITEGARYAHVRDDHATCEWEGLDVEHDDPSYRCDLGLDGEPFVGLGHQSVAGHVNIRHKGNKPWLRRDPSGYKESAKKGAATRAAKKAAAKPGSEPRSLEVDTPIDDMPKARNVPEPTTDTPSISASSGTEHRGLPQGEVKHRKPAAKMIAIPTTPAAKLAAIRAILGDDPRVAVLQHQVDELKAHLDLVREALNLDIPQKK